METNTYKECPVKNVLGLSSLYTFSNRKFSRGYSFKGESHDFAEVVCVVSGKAGITADKNVYVLSAGQMIIHRPGEFHAIWSDCGTEPETLIFSFRASAFPELSQSVYGLSPEKIAELKNIYRAANEAFLIKDNNVEGLRFSDDLSPAPVINGKTEQAEVRRMHAEAEASIVVKRLELFLLSVLSAGTAVSSKYTSRSSENYMRILSVMEEKIGDALTLNELAEHCSMSVPNMEKTVLRYSGCGAMAYYNELKIQKAVELLSGGMNVKETALSLGFSNQNYFSACFKKHRGIAPSKLRK